MDDRTALFDDLFQVLAVAGLGRWLDLGWTCSRDPV